MYRLRRPNRHCNIKFDILAAWSQSAPIRCGTPLLRASAATLRVKAHSVTSFERRTEVSRQKKVCRLVAASNVVGVDLVSIVTLPQSFAVNSSPGVLFFDFTNIFSTLSPKAYLGDDIHLKDDPYSIVELNIMTRTVLAGWPQDLGADIMAG